MKTYVMLVGTPCSGKSTYARKIMDANPDTEIVYLSSDDYIEKKALVEHIDYQSAFALYAKEAIPAMNKKFSETVSQENFYIIHDQTNMTVKKRTKMLRALPALTRKFCYIFSESREVINERNTQRYKETGKLIPEYVLNNMFNSYEEPTYNEGWDYIWNVKNVL